MPTLFYIPNIASGSGPKTLWRIQRNCNRFGEGQERLPGKKEISPMKSVRRNWAGFISGKEEREREVKVQQPSSNLWKDGRRPIEDQGVG